MITTNNNTIEADFSKELGQYNTTPGKRAKAELAAKASKVATAAQVEERDNPPRKPIRADFPSERDYFLAMAKEDRLEALATRNIEKLYRRMEYRMEYEAS